MDYDKFLDDSLKTMKPNRLNESVFYPDKIVGKLWQISAQYPGMDVRADLLVWKNNQPTFVTTFMKSHLKAICFLSKAEAEEYAHTLSLPSQNAVLSIKQSPKDKLCVSTPEVTPGAYVVEETDIRKVDLDKVPFINMDGKVTTSKEDSYIKLTPNKFEELVLEPLSATLCDYYYELMLKTIPVLFAQVSASESTEHVKLPIKLKSMNPSPYGFRGVSYSRNRKGIYLCTYNNFRGAVEFNPAVDLKDNDFRDEVVEACFPLITRYALNNITAISVMPPDPEIQYHFGLDCFMGVEYFPFLTKIGSEVSLAEIEEMKMEVQAKIELYFEHCFVDEQSEAYLDSVEKNARESIHRAVDVLNRVVPEYGEEEFWI